MRDALHCAHASLGTADIEPPAACRHASCCCWHCDMHILTLGAIRSLAPEATLEFALPACISSRASTMTATGTAGSLPAKTFIGVLLAYGKRPAKDRSRSASWRTMSAMFLFIRASLFYESAFVKLARSTRSKAKAVAAAMIAKNIDKRG